MKLIFRGHDEKYAVEQSVMNLFPGERPVYGTAGPEDDSWAEVALEERPEDCLAEVEIFRQGYRGHHALTQPLPEDSFEREGRRRHAVARCFYLAYTDLAEKAGLPLPPWGMLTGVRPDKPALWALERGESPEAVRAMMEDTYFVSPERAALAVETASAAAETAAELDRRDIAAYIGIPFCPSRCVYCSFVSQSVEKSLHLIEPYVDALTEEIRSGGETARETGLRCRYLYMGGGTPTTLTPRQMDRVLTAFENAFGSCEEITVEAGRPDTIDREKLSVLRDHGVSRISVNPQSMEDSVLEAIGRRHTAADIRRAMDDAAALDFPHVNMDLIAGLPGDTPEGFRRSLEACIAFGTDNLTVHTLALKKGSRILTEGLAVPPAEDVARMLEEASPLLRSAGFAPYYLYRQKYMSGSFENIGWTRPGGRCRYNIAIMAELCSILSFGAAGSTKFVEPGTNHIERMFNLKYPGEYIERPEKQRENQAAFAACWRALR